MSQAREEDLVNIRRIKEKGGDHMQEACGVFGCVASGSWPTQLDVPQIIYVGLVALQHRGQESAGIVTSAGDKGKFKVHKGAGLVSTVLTDSTLATLKGNLGIGHTRYSTVGGPDIENVQPYVIHTYHGLLALGHNGELVNAKKLRQSLLVKGVGLSTSTDSELIAQLLSLPPSEDESNGPNWPARIKNFMETAPMAYSLVLMYNDRIYAVRDPYGNRPLYLGKLIAPGGDMTNAQAYEADGWVVSSESCAFQSIGASRFREVEPGEIVQISREGIKSMGIVPRHQSEPSALCIFEYVYFARGDSFLEGQQVYTVRKRCGMQLAIEAPVDADIVSTVPESANPAAMGFAEKSGLPFLEVLCKNPYVGRTFIQPNSRLRRLGVGKKFGPLIENLQGKRIVLVDDSIVRGNTIGPLIKLVKDAGAAEVHIRIASPPLISPCYMGINIPTKEELIANKMDALHLAESVGASSLAYLSVDGLKRAVSEGIKSPNKNQIGHCSACLTGNYPVAIDW